MRNCDNKCRRSPQLPSTQPQVNNTTAGVDTAENIQVVLNVGHANITVQTDSGTISTADRLSVSGHSTEVSNSPEAVISTSAPTNTNTQNHNSVVSGEVTSDILEPPPLYDDVINSHEYEISSIYLQEEPPAYSETYT